jgi:hypothetical protein
VVAVVALIKVLCVFAFVLFLIHRRCPIGIALLAGGIATSFLFGGTVSETGERAWKIWGDTSTREFVLLIASILAISITLDVSGQIGRITAGLCGFVRSLRLCAAALPAIVGLLPMPGGALFSAPMVQDVSRTLNIDAEGRTCLNHWFRHIWEYAWPLYPGVIYTAQEILKISVKHFSLVQSPLCLVAIATGAFFFLRRLPHTGSFQKPASSRWKFVGSFVAELSPFLLILILHIVAGLSLFVALGSALCYTVLWNLVRGNVNLSKIAKRIFLNKHYLGFLIMGYGVMTFGQMFSLSGAIDLLAQYFSEVGIPVLLLVMVLPLVIGFVSGITIVFCSAAFPLLIALPEVAANPLPHIVLAYACGFAGTLFSPIHACLALTSEYFRGNLIRGVLRLFFPALFIILGGVALFYLYSHFGVR